MISTRRSSTRYSTETVFQRAEHAVVQGVSDNPAFPPQGRQINTTECLTEKLRSLIADSCCFMLDMTAEIDVRKTHTSRLIKIPKSLSLFDVWKRLDYNEHDYSKFHCLNVYLVKPTATALFLNMAPCLVYGMASGHYADMCQTL